MNKNLFTQETPDSEKTYRCPTCKIPKPKTGYYWRRNNPTEKTHYSCKVCETEKQKVRNLNKRMAKQDPLYAYFH